MTKQSARHRVVIVGGGFGGLYAAKSLGKAPVDVTLIDKRNFHLFQPLLYQVATGTLSPADISSPLRGILSKNRNTKVLMEHVIDLDINRQEVVTPNQCIPYDTLIVATGVRHQCAVYLYRAPKGLAVFWKRLRTPALLFRVNRNPARLLDAA